MPCTVMTLLYGAVGSNVIFLAPSLVCYRSEAVYMGVLAAVISFLLSAIGVFGGNDITSLGYYWRVS